MNELRLTDIISDAEYEPAELKSPKISKGKISKMVYKSIRPRGFFRGRPLRAAVALVLTAVLCVFGSGIIAYGVSENFRGFLLERFGVQVDGEVNTIEKTMTAGGVRMTAHSVVYDGKTALVYMTLEREDGGEFSDTNSLSGWGGYAEFMGDYNDIPVKDAIDGVDMGGRYIGGGNSSSYLSEDKKTLNVLMPIDAVGYDLTGTNWRVNLDGISDTSEDMKENVNMSLGELFEKEPIVLDKTPRYYTNGLALDLEVQEFEIPFSDGPENLENMDVKLQGLIWSEENTLIVYVDVPGEEYGWDGKEYFFMRPANVDYEYFYDYTVNTPRRRLPEKRRGYTRHAYIIENIGRDEIAGLRFNYGMRYTHSRFEGPWYTDIEIGRSTDDAIILSNVGKSFDDREKQYNVNNLSISMMGIIVSGEVDIIGNAKPPSLGNGVERRIFYGENKPDSRVPGEIVFEIVTEEGVQVTGWSGSMGGNLENGKFDFTYIANTDEPIQPSKVLEVRINGSTIYKK